MTKQDDKITRNNSQHDKVTGILRTQIALHDPSEQGLLLIPSRTAPPLCTTLSQL